MADQLKSELGVASELVRSSGGVFEVEYGGKLVFSKAQLGRFPDPHEVVDKLRGQIYA